MKRIYTILAAVLLTASLFAQSPEKMTYQAVMRNATDQLVSNQAIGMQISLLQTTATGTAVYVETQTPTTNANGLVSIEIGAGTIVSGDFATIDWGNDIYFIKTETDPTGGTNYTITGTSQLLSVPYALHAKTAESITGGISETDPVFTAWDKSTGINITESQITDLQTYLSTEVDPQFASWDKATGIVITESQISDLQTYLTAETDPIFTAWDKDYADLTNQPTTITPAQASEITDNTSKNTYPTADATKLAGVEAGAEVNINELPTTGNAGDMNYWNGTSWVIIPRTVNEGATLQMISGVPTWTGGTAPPAVIGDFRDGGVVFYVDGTGQHGLVCDVNDLSTAEWGCDGTPITGADGTAIGTGAQNTIDIEAGCTTAATAADLCANLTLNSHSDWFLPSKDELNEMYINKTEINLTSTANGGVAFAIGYYWSSAEYNSNKAWKQYFGDGFQSSSHKNSTHYVRAVRTF